MAENVMTPKFRVSFPWIFRPQHDKKDPSKTPKYGLAMLFDANADLSVLKKAALDVLVEKFGPDKEKWPKRMKNPFKDQGEYDYKGYEKGCLFIRATSKQRPGLVDAKCQEIIDESDFYAGCYARATVRAFWYDNNGNCGVSFGLQNVQKLADGEPLGGRSRAEDDFEPVADAAGAVAGSSKNAADIFG